jgi:hypothetical protein
MSLVQSLVLTYLSYANGPLVQVVGTPQVLSSTPSGSKFQAVVKKIPSSVPGQSIGQEPAHSQVTVPYVWMGQEFGDQSV